MIGLLFFYSKHISLFTDESNFRLSTMTNKEFSRLPTNVVPRVYHLHLTPNFESFKFDGSVQIEVEVVEATNEIVMNAAELEIKSATVGGVDAKFELNEETEKLVLTLPKALQAGKHTVSIEFVGTHNDNMKGFYRTKSKNQDGVDEWSFVTQFAAWL